jgi:hypothetical protein
MIDRVELRIQVSDDIARESLWHALAPEALAITAGLHAAVEQQWMLRELPADGYQLQGISVTNENGTLYAELVYVAADARA